MDFTKEQISEVLCKHAERENGLQDLMEKCGFKDTGQTNWCSYLYHGDDRPVHIMKLEYALDFGEE